MDLYLLLAPLLLLPVLFLWRLSGCFLNRSGLADVRTAARTRPALGPCSVGQHVVEFVVLFPKLATEAKSDFDAVFRLVSSLGGAPTFFDSPPGSEDVELDRTWTIANPTQERFIFFGCVEELSEGQFEVQCRVRRADGSTLIEGSCTGGPPTAPDLRIQFVGATGDTTLASSHCFDAP